MEGKLIVIEGLDGSGKATQTTLLYDFFKKSKNIKKISFPDYTQPSSSLVKMYLNSEFGKTPLEVNAYAASSFYAVDRFASYNKFWKKDYNKGNIIISDRYATSNAIYQMPKLCKSEWESFLKWICDFEYKKLMLPKPSFVVYLDMPIDISQKFMTSRYNGDTSKKDLHERDISFLIKCREAALYTAEKWGFKVVKCSKNGQALCINEIHEILKKVIISSKLI